jgi:hypothetical protein
MGLDIRRWIQVNIYKSKHNQFYIYVNIIMFPLLYIIYFLYFTMVQMAIILLDADNTFDVKTERARYMINSFKQYLDELTPPLLENI